MSKVLAHPDRPVAARRSKVDRSWRLLAGTATVATTSLLLWLIVAAILGRGVGLRSGLVLAIEPPDAVAGALPPVAGDSELVAGALGYPINGSAADTRELERQLEGLMASGASPKVVFLSAVGISSVTDGEGVKPYFLPVGADPNDPGSMIPAEKVITILADRNRKGGPALLILDVAHLDSDRGTAVFANGFLQRLKGMIPEEGNLIVLTPCAPGQISWPAGPFGRSVFADCVIRSTAWGRGTVSDLHREVSSRVAEWARSYRTAEQTPLLLGNLRRRSLRLPPLRGDLATPALPSGMDELKERLRNAWLMHQRIADDRPDRLAPLPWRRYQDELLRAERLVIAGRYAEADLALNAVETLATTLLQQLDAPPAAGLPSYAIRIAMASPGQRETIRQEWEAYEKAIRRVLDGSLEGAEGVLAEGEPPTSGSSGEGHIESPAVSRAVSTDQGLQSQAITSYPRSAEGLLVSRYVQFVGLGGESDDLRTARLEGLRAAFDVAIEAERAAAIDGRLMSWVVPLVSTGDRKRREGQDLLFASDLALIRSAREPIQEAETFYREALALAEPLVEAIDLLQELADTLPYYGEWSTSDSNRQTMLGTLLDDAATLANTLAAPPPGWSSSGSASTALEEIRGPLAKARSGYGALQRAFEREVGVAARPGVRTRWRTLDALLRVPAIPVETRMTLLNAAAAPELSPLPAPESFGYGTEEAASDEAFWARALGLARLEFGLLRISGEPMDELRGYLGTAETWRTAPDAAFGAMDSFSQGVRRRRDALLNPDRRDGTGGGDPRVVRNQLDRADWVARVLPAAAMHYQFSLSESPSASRIARDRQGLLVWHARRLAEDLALELTRDTLLAASVLGPEPPSLAEARLALNHIQSRSIQVENLSVGDDSVAKAPGLAITGGNDLPEGQAAVLLKHDPAVALRARPQGGALVGVPLRERVERHFDIDFAEGVDVVPAVFYRGHVFDAGRVTVPQIEQVSVVIRQLYDRAIDNRGDEILVRGRSIKVPDQFEEHPDEGYLHPNSTLDYRLELTNWTGESLPVVVSQRWEEGPPREARVALPPGQSVARAAVGQISSIDFGPEATSRILQVEVREDGGLGRLLCKPKQITFRKLEPDQYISVHPHFAGGRNPQVGLFVHHLNTDRTTVPAHVTVAIEPFSAVLQIEAPQWVERGAFVTCRYRIVDPKVESLTFRLTIDGVPDAIVREYTIQTLREQPPPMPTDSNSPRL